MDEKLLGKCGFYCGVCPTYTGGRCKGCVAEHETGDCFTRDCVLQKGIAACTLCADFPCGTIIEGERCTVLDKAWLRWKKAERG